jgi:proteasome lid subunit RPN8/RPN11
VDAGATTLTLAAALVDALVAEAVAAAPREACGLLVGRGRVVQRIVPARNVDASPTRYTIDPADHFAALRAARRDGLAVIGAYHSHPVGPPAPSPFDRAEAAADFLYLIVGLAPAPAVAAWQLVDGNFVGLSLVRT